MGDATETLKDLRSRFGLEGAFGVEVPAEEIVEGLVAVLAPVATEDFYCVMDGGAMTTRYEGLEGLRTGWADFLGAFETILITPEATMREGPDGASVVEFVQLAGKPKGLDTSISADAAAVWRVRGGRLAAVEFHMDRGRAVRAVGLEP